MRSYKYKKFKYNILYDFIACLLIILSHFSNFIIHVNYTRIFPDIVLVVGVLCAAALCLTILLQIYSAFFRAIIFAALIAIVLGDGLYEYGTASFNIRLIAMAVTLFIALALVLFLREHTTKVLIAVFFAMLISTLVIVNIGYPLRSRDVNMLGWRTRHPIPKAGSTTRAP